MHVLWWVEKIEHLSLGNALARKKTFSEREQEQELSMKNEEEKKNSKKIHSLYKFSANFIFASNNKFYGECQMEAKERMNEGESEREK